MKKKSLLLFCLFLKITLYGQQSSVWTLGVAPHRYIDNPAVFELGQEEARAYHIPHESISLNGKWKFFWCDTPDGIPANFFDTNYSDKKWAHIDVPSNWEMQGYGDKLFRNVAAPFHANPPHPPTDYNPTGLYRRVFKIPADWKQDKQVFLRFEKVASASLVWINGQEVGYNEGAQEPAEYNITPYLKPGENTLAVCVFKYSDGYYLEGQDYWRLAGIFDDVWLYAAPNVRIFDWQVITDFDNTYINSELDVHIKVKDYKDIHAKGYLLKARLSHRDGSTVKEFNTPPFDMNASDTIISLRTIVENPLKWTSETPNLYTLQLDLYDAAGSLQDCIETTIGFKKTEICDGVFYLNGVPLKVNAQNSHMQHPELGHVMDEATIRKDFELLKQFNFNAVRTSHYPPVNKYLELANEYGLYVIDEVGDEAHATEWISTRPEYEAMYRDRARKMVLRDRNYPCILFWSAGNESGEGENITHVIDEGKKLDPTRYWMYGGNAYSHPAEEIIGPRYPTPMELEIQVGIGRDNDTRPSFMDEYLSVAGNGGGAVDDYWNVIYRHPRIMGGAIWDFVSPGLTEKIRSVEDSSPYRTPAHLMGNARIVRMETDRRQLAGVLDLNGHDQWVEVYRSEHAEIFGNALTLTFKVYPRKLISSCGSFITKGSYQFGVQQHGKESLEFYIYTDKKHSIYARLPDNWEYNWHQVTAVYDGSEMALYIDGRQLAVTKVSGNVRNFPFPINIGRNAEAHGQETSVYICDAQLDDVGVFDKAVVSDFRAEEAKLWLTFDTPKRNNQIYSTSIPNSVWDTYYSYGIGARTYGSIWPDRTVQPEMWQMKKSVQPLSFSMLDVETGLLEVWNRNHFIDASQYDIRWELMEDNKMIRSGTLNLNTLPLSRERVEIPYGFETRGQSNLNAASYRLLVRSFLKKNESWALAGHEVAWNEFDLCANQDRHKVCPYSSTETICIEDGQQQLTVVGTDFRYVFNNKDGQLISLVYKGVELLKSPIRLNLWRAPLANELDTWNAWNAAMPYWKEGYGRTLSTEMYSTGLDKLTLYPLSFSVSEVSGRVHIQIVNAELMGTDEKEKKDLYIEGVQCNGILNNYEYIIYGDGTIEINHSLKPEGRMPLWFPRVGLTLTVNDALNNVEWYGRGPQENYPDRKTGYRTGIYTNTVEGMYEPYLMPQDYGLRTDTRWLRLTDNNGIGLQFEMSELFNFNAYPYSTDNLTKAMYTYQLQKQDGITLNLDYATTGVGCTARGVLPSYRAQVKGYERKIIIRLIR